MPRLIGLELFELNLPFRRPFRHAAWERASSESLFMRCITDDGHAGYGETLPRPYVTGEQRARTFDLLAERILPKMLEQQFTSFEELLAFLRRCNGKAPEHWLPSNVAQTAAWCLVDLALLDTFGRAFGRSLRRELIPKSYPAQSSSWPDSLRYSAVLSSQPPGLAALKSLLKVRLYGISETKLKVDRDSLSGVRLARRVLGNRAHLRVDCNMALGSGEAPHWMARMADNGVESFEQPLAADDLDGMARLVAQTGLAVMADESFHDAPSLERLIARRACTAVNVRIAKCGGLIASLERCRRAAEAGLTLQVGCLVGETSHLSAAQLVLIGAAGNLVRYAEGCFGERLLAADPVRPLLQFQRRGRPPRVPDSAGFGTQVDMPKIRRQSGRHIALGCVPAPTREDGT